MSILVKIAESTEEYLEIFDFRYHTIKKTIHNISTMFETTKRVSDFQDSLPTTINIIAYSKGEIIGLIRSTQYDQKLFSHNCEFNFTPTFEELNTACHILDIVLFKENSYNKSVFLQMCKLLINKLETMKYKNFFATLGMEILSNLNEFTYTDLNIDRSSNLRPIVFDVHENYIKNFSTVTGKDFFNFREIFSRIIYMPGEFILTEGDKGNSAFLIDEGSVEIISKSEDKVFKIGTLTKGSLVGEMAMLTGENRNASALAIEETCTLCFDRSEFMEMMYKDPSTALDVFKIFSTRLSTSNQEIRKLKSGDH